MIQFDSCRLPNGLRVINHYDASTRMVAVNLLYDVGARDESPQLTGLAHLMEHLMFAGSAHVASYDGELQRAGGDSNAWTTNDVTNYYDVLPAQNVETAFWVESDRLMVLSLTDHNVELQKSVVMEEFKQRCLNQPYGDVQHLLHGAAYTTHPYRWPTIGLRLDDIAQVTTADVNAFYESHYSVDRLVLCVSGNVTFERTAELAQKWFGDLAPRSTVARRLPVEPEQTQPREVWAKRDVPHNMIVRGYHTCARTDGDYQATDLLSDVLANGDSSRFRRNVLTQTDLFVDLDASVLGSADPGMFYIRARLRDGVGWRQASDAIDAELSRLLTGGVTEAEVSKYANKFASNYLFENIGYAEKAVKLCQFELQSAAADAATEPDRYFCLTPGDVERVARSVLRPENCTTLYYGPDAKE